MKIITFFILFVSIFRLNISQEKTSINFQYDYSNKIATESLPNEQFVLLVENNKSIFKSYTSVKRKKALKEQMKTNRISTSSLPRKSNMKFHIEKKSNSYYYFDIIAGAKLFYEASFDDFNWELKKEKKIKDSVNLFKAELDYGGREWIAWYNPKISISDGPYVFSGLPGLIVEIYDTDSIHHFTLQGVLNEELNEKDVAIEKKDLYQKVSYDEFIKYRKKAMNNYYEYFNNNSSLKLPEVSAEKKKRFNEKKKKEFIPIEITDE